MKTRDRKRRPRGGPNPSKFSVSEKNRTYGLHNARVTANTLIRMRGSNHPRYEYVFNWARNYHTPSEFRYVRIRLKEASR